MARYRSDLEDERDYFNRREPPRRDDWAYRDRYLRGRPFEERSRFEDPRGRFGERADYEYNEPRYRSERFYRDEGQGDPFYQRSEPLRRGLREYPVRSRLRCHEIMTRDLAVATRDTTLREVAIMMKDEDTGVIPVVDYEIPEGQWQDSKRRSRRGAKLQSGQTGGPDYRSRHCHQSFGRG